MSKTDENAKLYPHYFKDVSKVKWLDVYKVLQLFKVTNPCVQHAIKKLLASGNRGVKDFRTDINEAIKSLERAIEMLDEDGGDF